MRKQRSTHIFICLKVAIDPFLPLCSIFGIGDHVVVQEGGNLIYFSHFTSLQANV